jgi:hypothetical protein
MGGAPLANLTFTTPLNPVQPRYSGLYNAIVVHDTAGQRVKAPARLIFDTSSHELDWKLPLILCSRH